MLKLEQAKTKMDWKTVKHAKQRDIVFMCKQQIIVKFCKNYPISLLKNIQTCNTFNEAV